MKKSDLRTGMIVEYANGERRVVMLDYFIEGAYENAIVGDGRYARLLNYSENLTNKHWEELDINKVYLRKNFNLEYLFENKDLKLIWERKGAKKVQLVHAVHFGSNKKYTWVNDKELNISEGDVIMVETMYGNKMVQVVDYDNKELTEEEIREYKSVLYSFKED